MGIETLRVWQLGVDLVDRVYELTGSFPKEETYVLTAQMRRDSRRFVGYAQGSTAELWTQLLISKRRGYVTDAAEATELLDHVSRKLTNLRRSLLQDPRIPNPASRIPQHD